MVRRLALSKKRYDLIVLFQYLASDYREDKADLFSDRNKKQEPVKTN